MSTYRRNRVPGGAYFFTVVTHQRKSVFVDDAAVQVLRQAFRAVMAVRPFRIDAMVVLPEHMHCIWRLPPGDADYSNRWREIKKQVTGALAPKIGRPVWQPRFWEHTLRDDEDWRLHVDYIHFNPVKHGHVLQAADWPWSSFGSAVARGWYSADWGCSQAVDSAQE